MPSSPIPAPPPIDAAAGTPSLRTLGTGAQQAAAGADTRLSFATGVSAGILSAVTQAIGGAKTFQGVATPVTVSGNDNTGTAATLIVDNPGSGSGNSQLAMEINGVEKGSLFGSTAAGSGLVDGITVSAVTGKSIGFRVGTTSVASVNTTKWTIPQELHVTVTGIRFPDGSLQAVAAGGSQWTQVASDLYYAAGNVGFGASNARSANVHIFTAGLGLSNPFIKMEDTTLATSLLQFSDGTNLAGHFMPTITAKAVGSTASNARGLQLLAEPGTDASNNSAFVFSGSTGGGSLTASPLIRIQNNATQVAQFAFDGKLVIGSGAPGAWIEVKQQATNTGAPLFQLLDTDAASSFLKVYDVADTASEWQPLIHSKAVGTGTSKNGLTFFAEPTQDHNLNPAFVFDGRLSGVALDQSPIVLFQNFGTLRSKITQNGEQFWIVKIQGGAEAGKASIGYSGSVLGLDFEDTGGNSRSDIRLLAGGGFIFATIAGNSAPPERMRLDPNGLLGIGVTPARTLDVKTSTANDATVQTQSTGTLGYGGYGFLDASGNRTMSIGVGGSGVTTVGGEAQSTDIRGTNSLILHQNVPFRFYGRASESGGGQIEQLEVLGTTGDWNWYQGFVFFDRSQRRVGIDNGDAITPAEKLEVNGNILFHANDQWIGRGSSFDFLNWNDTATPTGAFASSNGVSMWNARGNVVINIDSDNNTAGVNSARFAIFTNKATTNMSGSLFNIQEDGAVGVGTDLPTEKFQVAGVIHSTVGGYKYPDNTVQLTAVNIAEVVARHGDSMYGQLAIDSQGHSPTAVSRGIWHLDEASGTATAAEARGVYPLTTITGTPTVGTGIFRNSRVFGGAAFLAGASDAATISKVKAEAWTWGAWIKPSTIDGTHGIFSVGHSDNSNSVFFAAIKVADSKLYFGASDTTNATHASCPALATGTWYHVVVSRASGAFKLYVNGALIGSISTSNSTLSIAAPTWFIGTSHLGNFKGDIDDVWFEDREYAGSEIQLEFELTYHERIVGDMLIGGKLDLQGNLDAGFGTLVVDGTNIRVGVNNPSPATELDVQGVATISGGAIFGGRNIYKGATSITAHAGGGQASATALTAEVNFVTTVATGGDSVVLPIVDLGYHVVVFNFGANSVNIYPEGESQIDSLGGANPYSLASGSSREFWGQQNNRWRSR